MRHLQGRSSDSASLNRRCHPFDVQHVVDARFRLLVNACHACWACCMLFVAGPCKWTRSVRGVELPQGERIVRDGPSLLSEGPARGNEGACRYQARPRIRIEQARNAHVFRQVHRSQMA